jgi:hypothetical protein
VQARVLGKMGLRSIRTRRPSMRHHDRQGLLVPEIEGHPSEQPLIEPRMTEGASDDETAVLRPDTERLSLSPLKLTWRS